MMKRLAIISLIAFAIASCDKWPDDRPLDGMWQLMEVRRGGTVTNQKDVQVFWSMRRDILQLSSPHFDRRYAHYHHVGDSLKFYNFVSNAKYDNSAGDDNEWISLSESAPLNTWGIYPAQDSQHAERVCAAYRIAVVNRARLQLVNRQDTLTFRRY